jgi:hypothetical protein
LRQGLTLQLNLVLNLSSPCFSLLSSGIIGMLQPI